jgi:rubrerythrin
MTISEQILLEKCREIELLCKKLYDYFAEIHTDNEDAARLWRKTAMEEQNHADQFTLALKLRKNLTCIVLVGSEKVEFVIHQLASVFAKVQATPPSFAEALKSSIRLEKYLAEFHLGCVTKFEDDSYRKMFNAMMLSDQGHISSLQAAYDCLTGVQDWAFTG